MAVVPFDDEAKIRVRVGYSQFDGIRRDLPLEPGEPEGIIAPARKVPMKAIQSEDPKVVSPGIVERLLRVDHRPRANREPLRRRSKGAAVINMKDGCRGSLCHFEPKADPALL